jgi:hypothetical protein
MRQLLSAGTPRGWKDRAVKSILRLFLWFKGLYSSDSTEEPGPAMAVAVFSFGRSIKPHPRSCRNSALCTTGC